MTSEEKHGGVSRRFVLAAIAILFAGVIAYANSFGNEMFWDDNDGILQNTYVHEFQIGKFFSENLIAGAGFQSDYWRPILLITYALEWKLWGPAAFGYHATNTLIHIANAILVFFLLSKLFHKKSSVPILSAFLFLLHPLQTEAVTYVSGRGDGLSFFFTLAGLIFYALYKEKNGKKLFPYFLAFIAFAFALLSKERSVAFPGLLLLLEIWPFLKGGKIPTGTEIKDALIRMLPFALLAGIFLFLRGTVLNFHDTFNIYNAATYYTEHISARLFTFLSVIPEYLSLVTAPITLYMERSENIRVAASISDNGVLLGTFLSIAVFGYATYRLRKAPGYLFAVLFFSVAIFPASGILVPVAGFMQEHYMYIPIIGVGIFLGTLFDEVREKKSVPKTMRYAGAGVLALWIVLLGVRTAMRNADWRDAVTFYEQTLSYAPTSMRVWNNLGMAYGDRGVHEKALDAYARAIALNPANPIPYHNSGNTYEALGDSEKAREYWEAAIRINPAFLPSRVKLGTGQPL